VTHTAMMCLRFRFSRGIFPSPWRLGTKTNTFGFGSRVTALMASEPDGSAIWRSWSLITRTARSTATTRGRNFSWKRRFQSTNLLTNSQLNELGVWCHDYLFLSLIRAYQSQCSLCGDVIVRSLCASCVPYLRHYVSHVYCSQYVHIMYRYLLYLCYYCSDVFVQFVSVKPRGHRINCCRSLS